MNFYKEAREILEIPVVGRKEGGDLDIKLNNHIYRGFGIQHRISLEKGVYQLLTFLEGKNSVLSGSIDTRGLFSSHWTQRWPKYGLQTVVRSKAVAAISNKPVNSNAAHFDAEVTKEGEDYVLTAKVARQDEQKIVADASYSQKISDRWSLGTEARADRHLEKTSCAFAARYVHPLGTLVGTVTTTGKIVAHCSRRVSHYNTPGMDNVGLAAQFQYDRNTGSSQSYAGWEFYLPNSKTTVRGGINGDGHFKTSVEERMSDTTILSLTADCNHATSNFRFGVGVQVGAKPSEAVGRVNAAPKYSVLKSDGDRWRNWNF
eukprot:g1930.t1